MFASEDTISILVAAILGAMIGIEREFNGKPAGLRTNMLISIGAAVFTILSIRIGSAGGDGEPTRISAQIVSGIGFLGAGAIIQDRAGVVGLTTAASIWLVSSIGVACGSKQYILAVETTAMALVALLMLHPATRFLHRNFEKRRERLEQLKHKSES